MINKLNYFCFVCLFMMISINIMSEAIPSNEIWYTCRDGLVINPKNINAFGAKIISNEYRDGRGIITFNAPVTEIGYTAFYKCTSITSIIIPDSCANINVYAFADCSALSSVVITGNKTKIDNYAFVGCNGLVEIKIPEGAECIGEGAFCGCCSLLSINIPKGVMAIGESAFEGCFGMHSVTISDGVTNIGYNAFRGCSKLVSIHIPQNVKDIGGGAFCGCSEVSSIHVEDGNHIYDSRKDCNALIKTATNELIAGCKNTIIPKGVTSIGYKAFWCCEGLISMVIPDGVAYICDYAFQYCNNLTEIIIPASVTNIGCATFEFCNKLSSITSLSIIPPKCGDDCFNSINNKVIVKVPKGSINEYRNADGWKNLRIEEI